MNYKNVQRSLQPGHFGCLRQLGSTAWLGQMNLKKSLTFTAILDVVVNLFLLFSKPRFSK